MPRPGFVLEVDRRRRRSCSGAARTSASRSCRPAAAASSTRPSRWRRSNDIDGAIRHALLNPHDQDPLPDAAVPGHEADDRVRRRQPAAAEDAPPRLRQRVMEAVLDMAAEAGVDDVHIIAALGLHRRMHEYELRHALGDRIYDAFHPSRHAVPARRRGPRQPRRHRHDARGRGARDQQARRRQRPDRLRQHQLGRDGRRLEEHHDRPRLVPLPQPPPQPRDAARTRAA